jgi:lipopolysaccharide export LptBFGC system permease protein LptF
MDARTVVGELSATLAALRSAGEIGFWILTIFLMVVVALAVIAVIYQRIVISRFQTASKSTEETFKSVDAQLKTLDTHLKERTLGVTERDELRNIFSQQFAIVKDTNDELRIEMAHLRDQQQGLKDNLATAITLGLDDLRKRLASTTVDEISQNLPAHFKNYMRQELESVIAMIQLRGINAMEYLRSRQQRAMGEIP